MNKDIPMLRSTSLPERITLPVEAKIKDQLQELKLVHKVDIPEWLRMILKREVPLLFKDLKSSSTKK